MLAWKNNVWLWVFVGTKFLCAIGAIHAFATGNLVELSIRGTFVFPLPLCIFIESQSNMKMVGHTTHVTTRKILIFLAV
jgi:hypothetical protein